MSPSASLIGLRRWTAAARIEPVITELSFASPMPLTFGNLCRGLYPSMYCHKRRTFTVYGFQNMGIDEKCKEELTTSQKRVGDFNVQNTLRFEYFIYTTYDFMTVSKQRHPTSDRK
uniref:Secreted protein n=1 Tax=Steinernema glaseri TaxID=37863 RepID=A0A1I7ZJH6_9BILA